MKRSEFITRLLITAVLLVVVALPFLFWMQTPLIHASIAESGGWSQDNIQAKVGEPLHLKFTSDDVMHGFAVGQMDMQPVDIEPGKVSEATLTFDHPGIYTFYCTRWCGLNHWRMRGTIEVSDASAAPGVASAQSTPAPASPPLYVTLGINIDSPHPAPVTPIGTPSALRGRMATALLPRNYIASKYLASSYYRSHSPAQVFSDLRTDETLKSLSDEQVWDLVAFIWKSNQTPLELSEGRRLYTQNCAACHGEDMTGNGVFADKLEAAGQKSSQEMTGDAQGMQKRPANLGDPVSMYGASPARLEGKILRGGMGTGMPAWGPIFTDQQIKSLIEYLYTCMFDYSNP